MPFYLGPKFDPVSSTKQIIIKNPYVLVVRTCSQDKCNFKGITFEPLGFHQGDRLHHCNKHNLRIKNSPSMALPLSRKKV